MSLDLTPGHGNLLGESYWELISPWRGGSSMLNTGPAPLNEEDVYLLSQILQADPPLKYYLSRTACLGILRRAKERGKELPKQLKAALMAQAGLCSAPTVKGGLKAYHINQRDEGIDLHGVSGALMATSNMQMQTFVTGDPIAFAANQTNGAPMRAQRSGSHGESGMSELSPSGGSEGYGACGDEKQQTFIAENCLNPWDTQQQRVFLPDGVSPTLAGADGGGGRNPGGLLFAAFSAGAGAKAGSIGYSEEIAPTLKGTASGNCMPSVLCLNDQGGSAMECSKDVTGTLRAQEHGHQPLVFDNHGQDARFKGPVKMSQTVSASFGEGGNNQPLVFENYGIDARYTGPHPVSPTITARAGTGGGNLPLVADELCYCITGNAIDRQPQNGGNGIGYQEGIAYTLTATDHHAVFSRQRVDVFKDDDVASTESARQHKDATDLVCQPAYQETVGALTSSDRKGPNSQYVGQDKLIVDGPFLIRRLTPLECERLQGFPDGWTDLPGASDSARYKALGNSIAVPCVEYIMRGIAMAAGLSADSTSIRFHGH